MEATLVHPDVDAFRMAAQLAPAQDCAGIPELVGAWAAYLKTPEPARKRELFLRLEDLAAQYHWIPSDSVRSAIEAAKAE